MVRLILHAGFPKCGSTSIFVALQRHLDVLNNNGVSVLDRSLRPQKDREKLHPPLWEMQQSISSPEQAAQTRGTLVATIGAVPPDETLILSTENLSNPKMATVFEGLEAVCEVNLIFYFRPQIDWIPSAWKQWNLKQGFTMSQTVDQYVRTRKPDYFGAAEGWQAALPNALICARPFVQEMMTNGDPAQDFFSLLKIPFDPTRASPKRSNPSIDFGLLHLMMRHHDRLFTGRHDNAAIRALFARLPEAYHRTNALMLTQSQTDIIADAFHDDNVALFQKYADFHDDNAEALVRKHFHRTVNGLAYGDMPEDKIMQRAERILAEITDDRSGEPSIDVLLNIIESAVRSE